MRSRPAGPLLILMSLMLVLVACVPDNRPAACAEASLTIDVTVRADGMEPSNPSACSGQDVSLVVTSDVDAVFHVHGLDEELPATTISAGATTTLDFTAERIGQFPIELHLAANPQGVSIGILTIYDR